MLNEQVGEQEAATELIEEANKKLASALQSKNLQSVQVAHVMLSMGNDKLKDIGKRMGDLRSSIESNRQKLSKYGASSLVVNFSLSKRNTATLVTNLAEEQCDHNAGINENLCTPNSSQGESTAAAARQVGNLKNKEPIITSKTVNQKGKEAVLTTGMKRRKTSESKGTAAKNNVIDKGKSLKGYETSIKPSTSKTHGNTSSKVDSESKKRKIDHDNSE